MGMSCIYGTADNQYPVPSTKYQVPSETHMAQHFKDLVAWQKAMDMVTEIYKLT